MNAPTQQNTVEKLSEFIQLEREFRSAKSIDALGFIACNRIRNCIMYDTALLLHGTIGNKQRVAYIAGVADFEPQAPLVALSEQLINSEQINLDNPQLQSVNRLPDALASGLRELQLRDIVTVPLIAQQASMVFIRTSSWQLSELQLLEHIGEAAGHALSALHTAHRPATFMSRLRQSNFTWRIAAVATLLCALIPVRQSVIADGLITAKSPTVVASGINGVIKQVLVRPNEAVKQAQLLVEFDDSNLIQQKKTVSEELKLAFEQLRKARQQSLSQISNAGTANGRFAELEAQIEAKNIQLAYTEQMIERLQIRAQTDGIAIFGDPQDWNGRSVSTGEKIMEIANAEDQQFEIWLAANDAIDIQKAGDLKFFPDAFPLRSIRGTVDSISYFPMKSPWDTLSYRIRGTVGKSDSRFRLGTKGTVRLYGERVSVAYYVFRKPLSVVRRWIGI